MPQDRHGFVKYPVKMLLLHGLSVQIVSSFPIITKYKMQEVEKTFIVGKALKMTKKKPLLDQVRKKKMITMVRSTDFPEKLKRCCKQRASVLLQNTFREHSKGKM